MCEFRTPSLVNGISAGGTLKARIPGLRAAVGQPFAL
jgi:hypothetical protein